MSKIYNFKLKDSTTKQVGLSRATLKIHSLIKIITKQGFIDKNAEVNVSMYNEDFDLDIVKIMKARICVNRMKV